MLLEYDSLFGDVTDYLACNDDELFIPKNAGMTCIGENAFYDCQYYRHIFILAPIRTIERLAFYNCYCLQRIDLPNSLTEIKEKAFYSCGLKKIALPDNLHTIGREAFCNCGDLTEVHIPKALKNIGAGAFRKCISLRTFHIHPENHLFSVRNGCLFRENEMVFCPVNTVDLRIPEGTESTGEGVFDDMPDIRSISFPATMKRLNCRYEPPEYSYEEYLLELRFRLPGGMEVHFPAAEHLSAPIEMVWRAVFMLGDFFYMCADDAGRLELFRRLTERLSPIYVAPLALYMVLNHSKNPVYMDFVTGNLREIMLHIGTAQDAEMLDMLLAADFLSKDETEYLLDLAIRNNAHTLSARLLEYKHRKFGFQTDDELL